MPPDAQHVTVLRVVIREDFSRTLAERLVMDIQKVLHEIEMLPARLRPQRRRLPGRRSTTRSVGDYYSLEEVCKGQEERRTASASIPHNTPRYQLIIMGLRPKYCLLSLYPPRHNLVN
ncbi:hypothetical protein MLD38_001179 [Melastoma candidum]|uniref:Uncharacterized protein n=1 Tax=Melastoma candidum TaxID=119954 RepID=A0ACB9SBV6_9MYRT|nr:hypothetical protein MLD38_001179 [Melastoma candidum]